MSEFIAPNSETAIQEAAKQGMKVVFPAKNELQIDIDDKQSEQIWKRHRQVLDMYWGIVTEEFHFSKSGPPKMHGTILLKREISDLERCALQAMLGSDRMREILSLIQVHEGDPHPTLFVERQEVKVDG